MQSYTFRVPWYVTVWLIFPNSYTGLFSVLRVWSICLLYSPKWVNDYYFDHCLAMGLRYSCAIFEKFSSSLEWLAMQHLHVSAVLHILGNFFLLHQVELNAAKTFVSFLICATFLESQWRRTKQ